MERIKISNGSLTAGIHPHGAELQSLKDSNNREYMWEGDPKVWGKHSPVLFPIVGTLKNNTYLYQGKIHALPRHGFARDNIFTLKSSTENSAVFSLVQTEDIRRVYPFDFELEIKYDLTESTLNIEYAVTNKGTDKMPFSIGAHPAFALPEKFGNYTLAFEKEEELISTRLENDLLSDQTFVLPVQQGKLPISYELFEKDALIFKSLKSRAVTIIEGEKPLLKVRFDKFPHLGIWTKDKAPFICIEPWQGFSDPHHTHGNIMEKEGIVVLEGMQSYPTGFSIDILR